ncbi:ferric reductase-like transmembrane domain-containing protein [Polynucleobacter necessarius]|uniref:ferric reductase-like transmembrane domain-containing protein n=1 Tax=Polynucleobacter necessarius TaxID=576610 RepID=UPI001E2CD570|nr:ferric reductase-like transmembrane domain-containing protein [Polynucleobacter necessarius]
MWADVIKRPFITMGFLSFVLLIPLDLTSNQWAVRLLGRRWALLHKLIYLIACTAIVHYRWHKAGKNDEGVVMILWCSDFGIAALSFANDQSVSTKQNKTEVVKSRF